MNPTITLSAKHTADVTSARDLLDRIERPVIRVFEDGRLTPGQWYAETLVEGGPSKYADGLYIDFGAGWKLDANEAALLYGFAVGVLATPATPAAPVHTVRGRAIGPEGVPYGTTHDMDCPACQGTPFTASPRSETYWAS